MRRRRKQGLHRRLRSRALRRPRDHEKAQGSHLCRVGRRRQGFVVCPGALPRGEVGGA